MLEYFQDDRHLFIVTELCTGGELFDFIVKAHHFSEKNAAETIVNSLERAPLAVALGFAKVPERAGLKPPGSSSLSYGLDGVATFRWLKPGETLVTRAGEGELKNFHWFFFQSNQESCAELWVGECGVDFAC